MLDKIRGGQLNSLQDRDLRYEQPVKECGLIILIVFKIVNVYANIDPVNELIEASVGQR